MNQFNLEIKGQTTTNNLNKVDHEKNDLTKIEGSIGIITTNSKYRFGDTIAILNDHGRLLKQYVISHEYQIMDFRVISINNDYYKIRLSDSIDGYLSKLNPLIKFQPWEEHILSVFCVDFNPSINSIRKNPSLNSELLPYDKDEYYFPVKIQANWLQIKWGRDNNWKYGWINWQKNGILLIEIFYFA